MLSQRRRQFRLHCGIPFSTSFAFVPKVNTTRHSSSDSITRRRLLGLGLQTAATALIATQANGGAKEGIEESCAIASAPAANTRSLATTRTVAVPWTAGMFRHILSPPGMEQARKSGSKEQWYINDHCFFVDSSERIHWFGITNPYPADTNFYGPGSHHHIGHAVAKHPFGPWEARDDALTVSKDSSENIGACFVVQAAGEYLMIYGYNTGFHFARSRDLFTWTRIETLPTLDLGTGTRDPCVLSMDDGLHFLYGAAGYKDRSAVVLASSRDFSQWKQEEPALVSDIHAPWDAGITYCMPARRRLLPLRQLQPSAVSGNVGVSQHEPTPVRLAVAAVHGVRTRGRVASVAWKDLH